MTKVFITTSFPAFHRWPAAPDECAFLRDKHRHVFHVRMEWQVNHNDRDIEFITMKQKVDKHIQKLWAEQDLLSTSCEMIAEHLFKEFGCIRVEVSEDGENGAVYEL